MQTNHSNKNKQLYEIPDSYVILDLETSGLSAGKDQIIELEQSELKTAVQQHIFSLLSARTFLY